MIRIIKKITVDVARRNTFQAIIAKQNDQNSRFLEVTLTNEGSPITIEQSSSVMLNAKRADGESKSFSGEVNTNGTVTVPLANWMLMLDDIVHCDITIIDGEERKLTSTSFTIEVESAANADDDVIDDDEFDVVSKLISECVDATTKAQEATQAAWDAIEELRDVSDSIVEIKSWKDVQDVVRNGKASEVFQIGDILECTHSEYGVLKWDVIGIDQDTPADSQYEHSLTLQLHNMFDLMPFDHGEGNNPDSDVAVNGSNEWVTSFIRLWLNSEDAAGDWWTPQSVYDSQPTIATSKDGFLYGMDSEFLSVMGSVRKITHGQSSIDRFFLLSVSEVYGGLNGGESEGESYRYYEDNTSLSKGAGTGEDRNRIKYLAGTAKAWHLRSPNTTTTHKVRVVAKDGSLSNMSAKTSYGVAPACCVV